jgi:hypothetical protein
MPEVIHRDALQECRVGVSRSRRVFKSPLYGQGGPPAVVVPASSFYHLVTAELRREREDLLDTVWLATSPAQVKDLWQKLGSVLGDEYTPLQQEALSIQPAQ